MGTKIDGKKLAEGIKEELKRYIEMKNSKTQIPICMANILVGNDGGSKYYVNNQNKLCNKLGVKVKSIYLDDTVKEEELLHIINELNKDKEVHGIIIQLPLPEHLDEAKITSAIDVNKDIDGLSSISVGKLYKGENCFVPCTPRGIIEIIKSCNVKIEGSNAVVIGRSNIVGRPVAQLLLKENATVTICHSKTENLKEICSKADILVAAVGKPKFVTKEYVKEGAVVIDVGTSSVEGKLVGDVCFDEVIEKAGFVTPVPGGVGAMTTTMLIKNLCEGLK
ncbi:methenyltetrahydrofolate cyclohydrolase [Clostridium novyi B str. ATCC 27606]|uniref:Bifunctional protein FolD n=1 Tax=Clostridium novyi B str. ATCC 27606 TaxID=1443123 RepID=A0AA40IUM4_CLONO|nr:MULTISPECIES: bifunctional methylenetetrahydrofolate dehydrogenase/methenyltetrahydrofolate cyclohydrolase [Clostridium]KEI14989.1 methenyltetrahydrofolate cyclohydrolase [Clostridium novyi B str. NCTC 9691]KEI16894.1 methenyltetrahydrofolate cyclohydrolase [Clostridium novyi B str. ATCC 27606]CAG7840963.1 Bifunctional protein FolD protein [Clostridium haemolyticum]